MIDVPAFWADYERRRFLFSAISGVASRGMDRIYKRQKHNPVAEFRAQQQAMATCDDRFVSEARKWVSAAVAGERELIASEIEAAYPDIGKVIGDAIRGRPDPLSETKPEVA